MFPDQAPSRYKLALRSGSSGALAARLREGGDLGDTPAEAAENALVLLKDLAKHDRLTRGHSERVRAYSEIIGEELGPPRGRPGEAALGRARPRRRQDGGLARDPEQAGPAHRRGVAGAPQPPRGRGSPAGPARALVGGVARRRDRAPRAGRRQGLPARVAELGDLPRREDRRGRRRLRLHDVHPLLQEGVAAGAGPLRAVAEQRHPVRSRGGAGVPERVRRSAAPRRRAPGMAHQPPGCPRRRDRPVRRGGVGVGRGGRHRRRRRRRHHRSRRAPRGRAGRRPAARGRRRGRARRIERGRRPGRAVGWVRRDRPEEPAGNDEPADDPGAASDRPSRRTSGSTTTTSTTTHDHHPAGAAAAPRRRHLRPPRMGPPPRRPPRPTTRPPPPPAADHGVARAGRGRRPRDGGGQQAGRGAGVEERQRSRRGHRSALAADRGATVGRRGEDPRQDPDSATTPRRGTAPARSSSATGSATAPGTAAKRTCGSPSPPSGSP